VVLCLPLRTELEFGRAAWVCWKWKTRAQASRETHPPKQEQELATNSTQVFKPRPQWLVLLLGLKFNIHCSSRSFLLLLLFLCLWRPLDSRTRTTTSTRCNWKFFRLKWKHRHLEKLHSTFCPPEMSALFFLLKEVKPSPYRKMIKPLTFYNLFPPLRHPCSNT